MLVLSSTKLYSSRMLELMFAIIARMCYTFPDAVPGPITPLAGGTLPALFADRATRQLGVRDLTGSGTSARDADCRNQPQHPGSAQDSDIRNG